MIKVEFGQAYFQTNFKEVCEAPKPDLLHFKGIVVGLVRSRRRRIQHFSFVLDLHRDFEKQIGQAV